MNRNDYDEILHHADEYDRDNLVLKCVAYAKDGTELLADSDGGDDSEYFAIGADDGSYWGDWSTYLHFQTFFDIF